MKKNLALPRRTFMKAAAGFAGANLLGGLSFNAFAQAASLAPADHCFVFAYFNGGWDVLLSLDPRDPATFNISLVGRKWAGRTHPHIPNLGGVMFRTHS